jgi:hypothetical protein
MPSPSQSRCTLCEPGTFSTQTARVSRCDLCPVGKSQLLEHSTVGSCTCSYLLMILPSAELQQLRCRQIPNGRRPLCVSRLRRRHLVEQDWPSRLRSVRPWQVPESSRPSQLHRVSSCLLRWRLSPNGLRYLRQGQIRPDDRIVSLPALRSRESTCCCLWFTQLKLRCFVLVRANIKISRSRSAARTALLASSVWRSTRIRRCAARTK